MIRARAGEVTKQESKHLVVRATRVDLWKQVRRLGELAGRVCGAVEPPEPAAETAEESGPDPSLAAFLDQEPVVLRLMAEDVSKAVERLEAALF